MSEFREDKQRTADQTLDEPADQPKRSSRKLQLRRGLASLPIEEQSEALKPSTPGSQPVQAMSSLELIQMAQEMTQSLKDGSYQPAVQQKKGSAGTDVGSMVSPVVQFGSGSSGGSSGSSGGTWSDYCDTLPSDLKTQAKAISNTSIQTGFKTLSTSHQRVLLKLKTDQARSRFITTSGCRSAVEVITATASHMDFYEKLFHSQAACRDKFEQITPDERGDLTKIQRVDAEAILADATRFTEWNVSRVAAELKKNLPLAAQLVRDINDAGKVQTDLLGLCEGQGGERLRRVAADPGFEVEQTKVDFVKDVRALMVTGKKSWDAMQELQPRYILKGKPTTIDPAVEVSKAIPLVSIIAYNTCSPALIDRILAANTSDPDYPKITRTNPDGSTTEVNDPAAKTKWSGRGFPKSKFTMKYLTGGGAFSMSDMSSVRITGRNDIAYWTYDPSVSGAMLASYTLDEIRQKLAVEESPDYAGGVLLVDLKKPATTALRTAAPQVRRPTCLDGLTFDQFALANPSLTYGVTSGGTGEVIVSGVDISQCDVKGIQR